MQSEAILLPWYMRCTRPQTLAAALGSFVASPAEPPEVPVVGPEDPPEGLYPLTFWVDGQPVASDWFDPGAARNIRESAFLTAPVELVLIATLPTAYPGWVRVDLSAVATSHVQLQHLLDLLTARDAAPIHHAGHGRPGLLLGHHWDRLPDELRLIDPDDEDSHWAVAHHFNGLFNRILYGDDPRAASRFLDSIPGIRGERPDADR